MRLMHLAKQCCNVTVAQLLEETKSPFVMIQLFEELVGGTGSKESQKTWISNSLAGTLLEQGFTLDWVASTTETLMMLSCRLENRELMHSSSYVKIVH